MKCLYLALTHFIVSILRLFWKRGHWCHQIWLISLRDSLAIRYRVFAVSRSSKMPFIRTSVSPSKAGIAECVESRSLGSSSPYAWRADSKSSCSRYRSDSFKSHARYLSTGLLHSIRF
jgi:hypothetical protein